MISPYEDNNKKPFVFPIKMQWCITRFDDHLWLADEKTWAYKNLVFSTSARNILPSAYMKRKEAIRMFKEFIKEGIKCSFEGIITIYGHRFFLPIRYSMGKKSFRKI